MCFPKARTILRDFYIMRKFLFFQGLSVSFQFFFKWFLELKFPLTATEYYVYNSIRCGVESIKLKTFIGAKMKKTGRWLKCPTLY